MASFFSIITIITTVFLMNLPVQNKPLEVILEHSSSDNEFDYYTIKLSNNSTQTAFIHYDPAAFVPDLKHNKLYCGGFNTEQKWYGAVLYNIDHLEISKFLEIPPQTCQSIYVKWEKKYSDWEKSLDLLYHWAENRKKLVINDIGQRSQSIPFPKLD